MLKTKELKQLHNSLIDEPGLVGIYQDKDGKLTLQYADGTTDSAKRRVKDKVDKFKPVPDPDWSAFLEGLSGIDGVYTVMAQNPLFTVLAARIIRLDTGKGQWAGSADPLVLTWNANPLTFTSEQAQGLQALADACFVPIILTEQGTLTAK